uniref:Corticotropin-releasing factor domain-containing protein n=1 Tax=Trichogramma kaykai TaxID=54128 RepID=A0ABD2W4U0_9HYME
MGKQQRRCSMMSLLSLLATTTLVGLAQAGPLARTSSHNAAIQSLQIPVDRDRFLLILLVNQKDFVAEGKSMEDMLEYLNEHDAGTTSNEADSNVSSSSSSSSSSNGRDKRMGSLSIVNSVDVLRQRVLLELARRKAMEDQRQISENRRLLDSVGKRSSYPGSSIMARKKDSSAADSSLEHDQLQRQFDELMMHVKFYRKKNKASQAKIKNSESFAHFFISLSLTLLQRSSLARLSGVLQRRTIRTGYTRPRELLFDVINFIFFLYSVVLSSRSQRRFWEKLIFYQFLCPESCSKAHSRHEYKSRS